MNHRRAYFYRALLGVDEEGLLLNRPLLQRLGDRLGQETDEAARLDSLGAALEETLTNRHGLDFSRLYRDQTLQVGGWVVLIFFLLGLGANYLGPEQEVNIMLNSLMGLLLWNIGVYLWLCLPMSRRSTLPRRVHGWLRYVHRPVTHDLDKVKRELLLRARAKFFFDWFRDRAALVRASVMRLLHLMALALTFGVLAGMYVRGLGEAYRFVWRSTFIQNEATFAAMMGVFFKPITALGLVDGLPPLSGDNGAAWIHLFAVTTVVYVGLPRFGLWLWFQRKGRRLSREFTVDVTDAGFQKLLALATRRRHVLTLFRYAYTPDESRLATLRKAATDVWDEVDVEEVSPIAWGELDAETPATGEGALWLVLFNGAQTPEDEVHGEFIQNMRTAAEQSGTPASVFVIIDTHDIPEGALEQRRQAWAEVVGERAVWADLEQPKSTGEALNKVVWA